MNRLSRALLSLITVLITACASTPPALQGARPAALARQGLGLAPSAELQQTSHMKQHLDAAKSVVYFQNQGGGGAGLGVLLGPLGVAANISMIEGVTQADLARLKGRIRLDPAASFQQAAAELGMTVAATAGANDTRATPYLLVSKTDEHTLHLGSALWLEGQVAGQPWRGRYLYQLPLQYTVDSLAALDDAGQARLQAEARQGFAALLGQIQRDTPEAMAHEPRLSFTSAYLSPRFEFEQPGSLIGLKDGMVWLRSFNGVQAVQASQVSYKLDKR